MKKIAWVPSFLTACMFATTVAAFLPVAAAEEAKEISVEDLAAEPLKKEEPVLKTETEKTETPKTLVAREGVAKTVKAVLKKKKEGEPFQEEFRGLVALGPEAIKPLADFAKDEKNENHQRWTALRVIGRINNPKGYEPLVAMLKNHHPIMRISATIALGDMGADEASLEIMDLVEKDPALVVRSAAIKTLGRLKSKDALPVLEKAFFAENNYLNGRSLFIRRHVVEALGNIQSPDATGLLIRALDDKDQTIGPVAILSLQQITGIMFKADKKSSMAGQWKDWWQHQNQKDVPIKKDVLTPAVEPAPVSKDI